MAAGTRKATAQAQNLTTNNRRFSSEVLTNSQDSNTMLMEEMRRLHAETNAEIQKSGESLKLEFKTEINEVKTTLDRIDGDMKKMSGKIRDLEMNVKKSEKEIDDIKREQIEDQEQILRLQLKQRENCLKFRGLPEKVNGNLYIDFSSILAKFVDESETQFPWELDHVYRLNSHIAKLRHLPRDVVVYFVRKQTRDLVLQQSYKSKLIVDGKEIMILKDIPGKILRKRKDYNFFIDKLKNYGIFFKWEEIEGVQVIWKQKKIRINSIEKAKDFLKEVQKEREEEKRKVDSSKDERGEEIN